LFYYYLTTIRLLPITREAHFTAEG